MARFLQGLKGALMKRKACGLTALLLALPAILASSATGRTERARGLPFEVAGSTNVSKEVGA